MMVSIYSNFVFGLYPPQLVFNITIAIDMVLLLLLLLLLLF